MCCRHDDLGRCIRPESWDGKDGVLFKEGPGWVCERCGRVAVTEHQAMLNNASSGVAPGT